MIAAKTLVHVLALTPAAILPVDRRPTDAELEQIIRDAVWRKELKHHVGEPGFRQPPRTMSAIGG